MKTKIKVAVALLVMIGVTYWALTSIWPRQYTGSNIMFPIGSGHVVINHAGAEAIPIEMRAESRNTIFRVASAELGLSESAKRQGTGRDAFYAVHFELPPGEARIDVTRGSGVLLITRADTPINATVTPVSVGTMRWILIGAGAVIAWALYYISKTTDHRWVESLRNKVSRRGMQPSGAASS